MYSKQYVKAHALQNNVRHIYNRQHL